MVDIWSLTLPAIIGAAAWLYQKTWERHERRIKQYENIMDELPAFTVERLDPDRIDRALGVLRRLWLLGPDEVVKAFEAFVKAVEGGSTNEERVRLLGCLVIEMRRDATFLRAFIPRFRTMLSPDEFRVLMAAKQRAVP
jgi:hypothetical protein